MVGQTDQKPVESASTPSHNVTRVFTPQPLQNITEIHVSVVVIIRVDAQMCRYFSLFDIVNE